MMVVKPKTTQSVEPDEEPVDLFNLTGLIVQKLSLSSRTIVQPVKVEPQLVDPHLNQSRSSQGAIEV